MVKGDGFFLPPILVKYEGWMSFWGRILLSFGYVA